MHYKGNIYRPPREAYSVLLQVTVGCSHNKCKFCNMYSNCDFEISPISEIEEDLKEVRDIYPDANRIFLLNGDAFVLSFDKLKSIFKMINYYVPNCREVTSYARVPNIIDKTVEELMELKSMGLAYLYVGLESGDDITLKNINKGYTSEEVLIALKKLEKAGIDYNVAFLLGLAGKGNGERNALETAKLLNNLKPDNIGAMSLSIFPETELGKELVSGTYTETSELEKLEELKVFLENLNAETVFSMEHITNLISMKGKIPEDKERLLKELQQAIEEYDEDVMSFRRSKMTRL